MPYISTEALVGAALVVGLALGYQYIPLPSSLASAGGGGSSKSKKKNKKKSSKSSNPNATVTDGSRQDGPTPADHGLKAGGNEQEAKADPSIAQKPKTLAQKLAPQPRKTKVDDMLAPEDLPGQHARVMRVAGPSTTTTTAPTLAPPLAQSEGKVEKFSDDYASSSSSSSSEEEEEEDNSSARVPKASSSGRKKQDDGWGVVAPKKKKPVSISFSSNPQASTSLALPTATKVQRKNQKKAEVKKATKAAEEEERLRRLAMHKRQLEKAKIDDLYSGGKKKGTSGAGQSSSGGGGVASKASLDHNGKLIWD